MRYQVSFFFVLMTSWSNQVSILIVNPNNSEFLNFELKLKTTLSKVQLKEAFQSLGLSVNFRSVWTKVVELAEIYRLVVLSRPNSNFWTWGIFNDFGPFWTFWEFGLTGQLLRYFKSKNSNQKECESRFELFLKHDLIRCLGIVLEGLGRILRPALQFILYRLFPKSITDFRYIFIFEFEHDFKWI